MSVILILSLLLPPQTVFFPLEGTASWYDWHPGEAAAGPALREWLGPDWRGQTVNVCNGSRCVEVTLTDWCWCPKGNRVIDLDKRSFARLAPPDRGLVHVEVWSTTVAPIVPTPPPTDTLDGMRRHVRFAF